MTPKTPPKRVFLGCFLALIGVTNESVNKDGNPGESVLLTLYGYIAQMTQNGLK
jgi:hypothetical protein